MDYLRTLGSAAVSSLVQKSGLTLPFSLGPKIAGYDGICNLYDGTKRDDGSPVSIFEYDFQSDPSKKHLMPLAKNSLRKLRSTRHPDVIKFMDAVESETSIYIMTERVSPLQATLQAWSSRDGKEREEWLLWGLHRISVALSFVNDPCASTHGGVRVGSIFITPSGEWKLGGFELVSNPKDDASVLYNLGGTFPGASTRAPPEVTKGGWNVLKEYHPAAADAYAFGLLLHTVFNPTHPPPATAQPPHPPPSASSRGSIPQTIFPLFKKLLNPNPKSRLSVQNFLELGMTENGFFMSNRLVKVCLGLDNFSLGSEADKNVLLRTLKDSVASFPSEFATHRVLPSLVSALEFGGASAATILPLVMQFGRNVSPEEYSSTILAPLTRLFASPDRGTRMALLEHLPEFVGKLDQKTVSDKIFPHLQTGFSDTVAIIREATVKSIILLSPKLNSRLLNNDLLRHLAKMQMDPEPSIRTNTCILIGRLGPTLGYNTKRKVLLPAFLRALKDPFVHARVAGLMAFMATIECFEVEEIANKVVPNISFTMIDKEKLVRDQAFKAVDLFVKKLESYASTMPETALADSSVETSAATLPTQETLVYSAAEAAGALAGWAISSLGKKLATSDLQSTISSAPDAQERSISAPQPSLNGDLFASSPMPTDNSMASPAHKMGPGSKVKSLQLRGNKPPPNLSLAAQLAEEVTSTDGVNSNPWGSDDLIDVHADEDDWSAFETAPLKIAEPRPLPAGGLNVNIGRNSVILTDTTSITEQKSPRLSSMLSPKPASFAKYTAHSVTSSRASTPISSPPLDTNTWDSAVEWDAPEAKSASVPAALPTTAMTAMTKEQKAAEMLRRKEERKQRIALLKEQKKNAQV